MKNRNNSNNINDVINNGLSNCIESCNFYICKLDLLIKMYENQLDLLKMNKPYIFQIKKRKNYNKNIEDYKIKIMDLYKKMNDEFDYICEIANIINN